MARTLVFTNPSHDDITTYFGVWMKKAISRAVQQPDTVVIELAGANASKADLEQAIATHQPQLVIFNGHGNESEMGGFNNEILIRCGENEHVLKGAIAHMMACDTAVHLGPKCIEMGGVSYIGYSKPFKLVYENNRLSETEKAADQLAAMILDPAFDAVIALIDGATVEVAFRKSQESHKEMLRLIATNGDRKLNAVVGSRVYHNLLCQVWLGDAGATF